MKSGHQKTNGQWRTRVVVASSNSQWLTSHWHIEILNGISFWFVTLKSLIWFIWNMIQKCLRYLKSLECLLWENIPVKNKYCLLWFQDTKYILALRCNRWRVCYSALLAPHLVGLICVFQGCPGRVGYSSWLVDHIANVLCPVFSLWFRTCVALPVTWLFVALSRIIS